MRAKFTALAVALAFGAAACAPELRHVHSGDTVAAGEVQILGRIDGARRFNLVALDSQRLFADLDTDVEGWFALAVRPGTYVVTAIGARRDPKLVFVVRPPGPLYIGTWSAASGEVADESDAARVEFGRRFPTAAATTTPARRASELPSDLESSIRLRDVREIEALQRRMDAIWDATDPSKIAR